MHVKPSIPQFGTEEPSVSGTESDTDPDYESLAVWRTPDPGDASPMLRAKEFSVVRMVDGRLALRKADSEAAFARHEGEILDTLRGVPCIPALLHRTNRAIYVDYIEGLPLLERSASASVVENLRLGIRVLSCIAAVHDRGVVHSDIRHWNFIDSRDGHLYLIDFEYAYVRTRSTQPSLLAVHHTLGLRPALADWADGLQCVGTLWHASASPFLRWGMSPVAFSASMMIRLVLKPREIFLRARRWQARRRSTSDARHD